jgi:hypothetical protein
VRYIRRFEIVAIIFDNEGVGEAAGWHQFADVTVDSGFELPHTASSGGKTRQRTAARVA